MRQISHGEIHRNIKTYATSNSSSLPYHCHIDYPHYNIYTNYANYLSNYLINSHYPITLWQGVPTVQFHTHLKTMLGWYEEFDDAQKNDFLKQLLDVSNSPQTHLLSTLMAPILHANCPHNCTDILYWLPPSISLEVSFLEILFWQEDLLHWKLGKFEVKKKIDIECCYHVDIINWKRQYRGFCKF